MLAVPGFKEALNETRAPVVAVSPLVGGEVVKGPTAAFMEFTELPLSSEGIAAYYEGIIDGLVADARTDRVPVLETDVLMASPTARQRVAEHSLAFALALR
jgi:LPPG:FO 2-phospho-L-lactate transferase